MVYCLNEEHALQNADALLIVTEWKQFRSPDFSELCRLLKDKVIFDGRNMYDPKNVKKYGLTYYGIGRS